ncbi:MAG TPA: bifunctional acetate--CoA ligase family protein/GNAT family N-acetyltransferase [Rhodocyclaceae bacterium]|nr:bifunctional acetate--CoA ligase family protein/GNAT family N-acetyltransferase [Rhodocyclaceae bacterium]HMV52680.1 bifunctional acetate--CoA ligase family protein/GNAT family N-acetyltransferase [Rhodocyclaceae bacterium]HMZ83546.1 bifunctional acetate--CoA ligase family protein/GNAT family N-acetyltransferase [Rhodocyclaceae bacterium]HNA04599.1 bifunctional acetate--CoA ligase family protein/GNAT family N-acetyltransferase [Rhodocyclaceae bacterium]HNB78956.1 bifunctional acetate--CoA li
MHEQHYLTPLFEPRSIAIIGASETEKSVGNFIIRNMLDAGFKGKLFAVNPKHEQIYGIASYPSVEDIPQRLDLVIIATAAQTVPGIIDACGRAGVKYVVVISAGFAESGTRGAMLERSALETARRHRIRMIGPNCLGIIRPGIGLNATYAHSSALPGSIGLISQSGALIASLLDWARPNNVGFSSVVSIGAAADIDIGEVLDFLVQDPKTENIFLYVEGIRHARRFMSALRAAARVKPVLLIKVGRHPGGAQAIKSHTGMLVGDDDVFDAALRRAGVVRLYNMGQMYAAASALFSHFRPRGNRLAVITNGGGPGVMAADRAADLRIPLARLSDATITRLNEVLPATWSHANPLDIVGDSDPVRYAAAVQACMSDEQVDGVLAILTPQAMTEPTEVAKKVIELAKDSDKPVVTCWMGEDLVRDSRCQFKEAGIPTFRTPEPAVELFSHLSSFYRNQKLLMQTPASLSHLDPPSVESARLVIESALSERRSTLNEMESKALLASFRIPIAQTVVARTATEAMVYAEELGLPVALKIDSPNIQHKTDSGGVRLNLNSLLAVRNAFQEIHEDVKKNRPDAVINGIAIEPMILKPNGRELTVGVVRDEVFGPVITLSEGGTRAEAGRHRAVALPPLNSYLAADMIRTSRVAPLLAEFRSMPAVKMEALELVLLRVSEMVCELPWIRSMEINPLIVDENGAVAVDARVVVENVSPTADPYDHMAIHPYPSQLTQVWKLADGMEITIRPIRPEDADLEVEFVKKLSPETKYFRFMSTVRELSPAMVARLTQIDYDREMAFIATVPQEDGSELELGVCRYSVNADQESCEFAVVVADDWQRRGLARKLMGVLIETARDRGLKYMNGIFLSNNDKMLKFVQGLGFVLSNDPEDNTIKNGVLALQG